MKFEVPQELAPGVFRPGVGLVRPGETLVLPDKSSEKLKRPTDGFHPALIPLDDESYKALAAWQAGLKGPKVKPGEEPAPHPLQEIKILKPGEPVVQPAAKAEEAKRDKLKSDKVGK